MNHSVDEFPRVVKIMPTGGTFDKDYADGAGVTNFTFGKSIIFELIERFALEDVDYLAFGARAMKDSLEMTDDDRAYIANEAIGSRRYPRTVIIHGTDTMTATAKVVAERIQETGNTHSVVVLTGSLRPARMRDSDAEFNFGAAIAFARALPPGVWICMHGKAFPWNRCRKDPKTGRFEEIPEEAASA